MNDKRRWAKKFIYRLPEGPSKYKPAGANAAEL